MTADPVVKTFAQLLTEALPEHTHRDAALFGPTSWTWSTPAGVWSVTWPGLLVGGGWRVTGPGGKWVVDAGRVLPVLRALGAISERSGGGRDD